MRGMKWDGKPAESRFVLEQFGLKFMPLAEGVQHFLDEIARITRQRLSSQSQLFVKLLVA